jgi:hypothetical protein
MVRTGEITENIKSAVSSVKQAPGATFQGYHVDLKMNAMAVHQAVIVFFLELLVDLHRPPITPFCVFQIFTTQVKVGLGGGDFGLAKKPGFSTE